MLPSGVVLMQDSVHFLIKGLLLGFSIAAPVGPIGLLCIRRSLHSGRLAGLATGLGVATADACYAAVAGFGLTGVMSFMIGARLWLTLIGGLFLCWLGVRTLRSHPSEAALEGADLQTHHAYLSALALTLTNPLTILFFVAAFAALGLTVAHDRLAAVAMIAGVFTGSTLWWLLLSAAAARLRGHLDTRWLQRVNWISGAILLGFGLYALTTLRRF
jgi:threonine/homoserine/homoserine lactone efflux protein